MRQPTISPATTTRSARTENLGRGWRIERFRAAVDDLSDDIRPAEPCAPRIGDQNKSCSARDSTSGRLTPSHPPTTTGQSTPARGVSPARSPRVALHESRGDRRRRGSRPPRRQALPKTGPTSSSRTSASNRSRMVISVRPSSRARAAALINSLSTSSPGATRKPLSGNGASETEARGHAADHSPARAIAAPVAAPPDRNAL